MVVLLAAEAVIAQHFPSPPWAWITVVASMAVEVTGGVGLGRKDGRVVVAAAMVGAAEVIVRAVGRSRRRGVVVVVAVVLVVAEVVVESW